VLESKTPILPGWRIICSTSPRETGSRPPRSSRRRCGGSVARSDYRDALAPGDLALIYLPAPEAAFIGRAELATAVHHWTPSQAEAYPGDSESGVLLAHVEEWDPAVPMDTVVRRIDPTASNPLVQVNAPAGFRVGVVRITSDEYENAVALSREVRY
jgi:hypothetical protein